MNMNNVEAEAEAEVEVVRLTQEEIDLQRLTVQRAIEQAVIWYDSSQNESVWEDLSGKEQIFMKLLAPLVYIMREAQIVFDHAASEEGCPECSDICSSNGNALAYDIAQMILKEK